VGCGDGGLLHIKERLGGPMRCRGPPFKLFMAVYRAPSASEKEAKGNVFGGVLVLEPVPGAGTLWF